MQKERRKNSTSTFYVIWEEEEKAYTKWHTLRHTQTGKESPTAIRNS